ncbi:Rne/Rng family ribonuclease [Bdellovibrionota bacterium FG-2]
MSTELIINASLPEIRLALMEEGEIQDLLIERPGEKGIVGNIYKGRVTRVLPGMQAAFVDIGLEKAAFLYVDDVFVHSEIWEEEEGEAQNSVEAIAVSEKAQVAPSPIAEAPAQENQESPDHGDPLDSQESDEDFDDDLDEDAEDNSDDDSDEEADDSEEESDPKPQSMGAEPPGEGDGGDSSATSGTIAPEQNASESSAQSKADGESDESTSASGEQDAAARGRRHKRGRRGGRHRRKPGAPVLEAQAEGSENGEPLPDQVSEQLAEPSELDSDRASMVSEGEGAVVEEGNAAPAATESRVRIQISADRSAAPKIPHASQRSRDRRIAPKASTRTFRGQVNIQDLLKEGQEVLVQVAKDPISTKGARLTCHISLPGRHLVCMPTIDHVGVSRRIDRDDERRRLRDFVERNRPKNLGFIVRTASGRQQSERRIKQDIDYLTSLWTEIREKAGTVTAPALVYEDLNVILRSIRDWVTEDIDKIIVDSRYHFNDVLRFIGAFMPFLKQKVELYHGDIPIFDAYNISTELSRALERKVWLKSGGSIVIDQAEALVAIDVNTGRFVGKKNLEDTILKTNLEAVQEIAYQLRLRNCGGIIILDLIDMESDENKHRVYRALEDALRKDRARPTILKISELGLVEMTRKRTRDSMVRSLCEACSHCEGKGYVKSKQTVAYEILREIEREGIARDSVKVLAQAHADVIDVLAIDERETLEYLEKRYRKQIFLQTVVDFYTDQFEVSSDKGDKPPKPYVTERTRDAQQERGDRNRSSRGRDSRRGGRDSGRDSQRESQKDKQSQDSQSSQQAQQPIQASDMPPPQPVERIIISSLRKTPVVVQPASVTITPVDQGGGPGASDVSSPSEPQGVAADAGVSPAGSNAGDDFYDEEDRLAFLRAQAAQDAALAQLRNPQDPTRRNPGGGGAGPGKPRRDDRGGASAGYGNNRL